MKYCFQISTKMQNTHFPIMAHVQSFDYGIEFQHVYKCCVIFSQTSKLEDSMSIFHIKIIYFGWLMILEFHQNCCLFSKTTSYFQFQLLTLELLPLRKQEPPAYNVVHMLPNGQVQWYKAFIHKNIIIYDDVLFQIYLSYKRTLSNTAFIMTGIV